MSNVEKNKDYLPFTFGKIATEEDFINREKEIERLSKSMLGGNNIMIISPRRWGKSSLVKRVTEELQEKEKVKVCRIDLFSTRSEEEFYKNYLNALIKATQTKKEELLNLFGRFFKKFIPKLSFQPSPDTDYQLSFDWNEVEKNSSEILDFPQRYAEENGVRFIVCIDEFQNLAHWGDSVAIQKRLRSFWQHHKQVSYCLYGSKTELMVHFFKKQSMPFYKFGEVIMLSKIHKKVWVDHIVQRFVSTHKKISTELAEQIVDFADCHSYYVQEMAQKVWLLTKKTVRTQEFLAAKEELFISNESFFKHITEGLTNYQLGLLKAIINNEKNLTSQDVVNKYQLGSPGSVRTHKKALISKEVLDDFIKPINFIDPIYKQWLKTYFFKM